ncbi:hypothetical protein B0H10DRAFT_2067914 [Mycena sp. CBHHK59/15]|nr:hypothetical protein B0H10DRAFT_2067914 [Mycena sp. CBHHK59/15]
MPIATRKKWDTGEVGTKIEAFAVAGCDMLNLLRTSKQKADFLKAEIRDSVSKALINITGELNAQMQYINYEEDLVHRYGVIIVGWTFDKLISPSDMSTSLPALQELLNALKSGKCHFVKLTPEELKERKAKFRADIAAGLVKAKERAPRNDKGVKRPRTAVVREEDREAEREHGDGEDDDADDDDTDPSAVKRRRVALSSSTQPDEPEVEVHPPPRKPRTKRKAAAPKAAPTNASAMHPGAKKTRDDATTWAALTRIKSRAFITSDDEWDDDPEADAPNDPVPVAPAVTTAPAASGSAPAVTPVPAGPAPSVDTSVAA